jgi:ATP phosphoribosyltransferase
MLSAQSSQPERLRIAVQKSGRLSSDSLELLASCGIRVRPAKSCLLVHAENFPLDLLFVRDDDIPQLVASGSCDLGIVGANVVDEFTLISTDDENRAFLITERTFDFGRCRLAIAWPEERPYHSAKDLTGLRIATSYPRLTAQFLQQRNIIAETITLSGSVEIAPRIGLADAICDLVSTGTTLEANKLRAVETIYESSARMIRARCEFSPAKRDLVETLLRRLDGVHSATDAKYIMLHAPKVALQKIQILLPGCNNPTVIPLANTDEVVAVHAVCRETIFWETMESLKLAGASSILVVPIEKMMS